MLFLYKTIRSYWLLILCLHLTISGMAQHTEVRRDARLDSLLNLKIEMQKSHKLGENYTIQLYSGTLDEGRTIMDDFKNSFPDWPVLLHYETPNYKVWAGNFSVRLTVDQALREIQRKFPSAFIFKPTLLRKETNTKEEPESEHAETKDRQQR
jgi:hypothetical protein